MGEQIQQRQMGRSTRRRKQQAEQPRIQTDHSSRERLAQLDAALDDYLTQTFTDNETAPIGLSQTHVRTQPLSNETLVRGFRQTIGE